jgi:UDP-GlcNAc:undecaprenyl-phosphate/decaprenyl-phosphate GlcNAc-1-phosphate transferase
VKDYVLTLLVAAAVTYLLTPLVRRVAIRVGAMHAPRERDVHTVPVPRMGGVAMYAGLAAGLLVASRIPQLRSNAFAQPGLVNGLLLAGGVLVVIGIIDDRWGLSALTKGAGQVAAGAILVVTGTQLSELPEPGNGTFVLTSNQTAVVTILVVVATINAVNFIDGLDGLAAGIVAIAAVSFLIYYWSMAKVLGGVSALAAPALASAILTGICLGFLPHNFHPARIFMGDTGAMLLGLVLAYAPIASINSLNPAVIASRVNRYPEIMPLLLPAALLVIPYTDMLLAVVRRTRAGLSPFEADSKHLHHRLISIGHSQRASVLVMYLWAALFSGSVVWFSLDKSAANHHGSPVLVFVVITAAAVLALVLMSLPRLRRRDPARSARDHAVRAREQPAPAPVPVGGLAGPLPAPVPAVPAAGRAGSEQLPPARSVVGTVPPTEPNGHHQDGNGAPPAGGDQLARTAGGAPEPDAASGARSGRADWQTADSDRVAGARSGRTDWQTGAADQERGPAETAPLPAIDAVPGPRE